MGQWSREELQQAHDHYLAVANECSEQRDWRRWADLFTPDAEYLAYHFGRFNGREAIFNWITETMSSWPNSDMTAFPHEWCVCDTERGWWVCKILNRMADPGDGNIYEEANLTVLHYAGDMQFSYEEDAYNPAAFGPMLVAWSAA